MNRVEAEIRLKQWFGLEHFYDEQWTAIERLLRGERVLMIQRTGFGKSLVFQFVAMAKPGVTIIFSPLIALMRDQVNKLNEQGIAAAVINSTLSPEEKVRVMEDATRGRYKMLYIAPERQEDVTWQETVAKLDIGMIVIDEAHCISVWGHDFRPAFKRIVTLVRMLPKAFPVLACTATATKRVEEDIHNQLYTPDMTVIRGSLARENFKLSVVKCDSQESKMAAALKIVQNAQGTGVIYCGTRTQSEQYSNWLEFNEIKSTYYTGRLDDETRRTIEAGFMDNAYKCVVATNALGMGVDKPDIRFVIHAQIPTSPLHYYQEIGRSGRDGKTAMISLLYNDEDDELPLSFIRGSRPSPHQYEKVIDCLRKEPMRLYGIVRCANMKQTSVRVILSDLIDQRIVAKVRDGRSTQYEYIFGAPDLDTDPFEELKEIKTKEYGVMRSYVDTKECRSLFLRLYLGDSDTAKCDVCDNCNERIYRYSASQSELEQIDRFRETYFPVLDLARKTNILMHGVSGSYYGVTNVGQVIHRCKYENGGDYPDHLLSLVLKAYRKHYGRQEFDMLLYVPPTESGDLVKNFAEKVARILKIPISHGLRKVKTSKPQKILESAINKKDNVKGVFSCNDNVQGKSILLIDDIYDSGATIKEIASLLKNEGATAVGVLTIAKTVGG